MAAETIGWIYPLPTKDACFAGYPVTMPITYLFSTPRGFTLWMDLIRDVDNFGPDSLPKLRHCDVTNQYRPDARFAFPAVAGAPWLVCKWTAYVNAGNWSGVPKGILTPPPPPPPALDKITGGGGRLGLEEWGWGWSGGWTWHVGTQNCVESLSTTVLYARLLFSSGHITLRVPGVASMQMSAYITHKNLALRKVAEAMRTAYAKSGTQHVRRHASIVKRKRASFANAFLFRWVVW